jgi:hypothetical protein
MRDINFASSMTISMAAVFPPFSAFVQSLEFS